MSLKGFEAQSLQHGPGCIRQSELFSALEEVKNGWVESPMYGRADELIMEPPHVWVFSNELPNLNHCSLDRWTIWHLRNVNGDLQFDELTMAQVQKMIRELKEERKRAEEEEEDADEA